MKTVSQLQTDEERALYHLTDALVENCRFEGPADGESALKETRNIEVKNCRFALRYPLWHVEGFRLSDSVMEETARAAVWYAKDGKIENCTLNGVKLLRECDGIRMTGCRAVTSEFGWNCRDISIADCSLTSDYLLSGSRDVTVAGLTLNGKYSFQYVRGMTVDRSELHTKDAFWHSENVTVRDSVIDGEYLGWYSEGLTLIRCRLSGTQPLCYCKNLTLIDCTMENADLAFEYSEVHARVKGEILSVKNPRAGEICADRIGEVIRENAVYPCDCRIVTP